jgi:DNA-binding response OmpR family regulator/DNA-binding CsgD family transcriptional regulator
MKGSPQKANILVVDDTPENLHVLTQLLQAQGYRVRPAPNGAHALTTALKEPPDLILLDIMMPEMDGYEVCHHLKADERTGDIPVIFISALDETIDKVTAFSVGGVDYVTKPFQNEEVLARVKTHLTLRRLQQEVQQKNEALQTANDSLEEKVRARTAELAQTNRDLQTEIEQRLQNQQEKDRLFETVSQQSEQLRNLTAWLIDNQNKERQGLAAGLQQEIEQNIELLQSNLKLVQTLLAPDCDQPVMTHLENAGLILQKMRRYVDQATANLDQTTAKEQTLSQDPLIKLTDRERQVLRLLAQGKTNAETADILTVALSTIHTYTGRIKQKLDIDNLPGLTKFAIEHKLLE